MTSIAFIGLGIMGSPMAVHLQQAGHDVVGYNLHPDKTKPLVEAGGRAAADIAEAVKDVDVVAVMVPDSPDVQDVLTGEGDVFGKTVVHVGGNGAGQTVKAANQLIVAANIQALAEAVTFLDAYDVDLEAALDVLGGGLAGSKVLDQKRGNMAKHDFTPGFRIDLHHKDMGIVTSAAREAGVV